MTARHTGRSLLCWLRSSRLESCGQNPFTLLAEDSSRKRYWRLWKRFIAFVIRGHRMPTSVRESETKIKLDVEHSKQLQHIWEHQVWATIDVPRGFWPARPSYAENHAPLRGAQPDISGPMRWSDARLSSNEEYDAESDEDNYETSEDEDELHKAKRLTNREFHVIRFLPIRLGVARFKYLVWIRRFANLLRRERSGYLDTNPGPLKGQRLVFNSNGNIWSISRLTAILQTVTSRIWLQKMNIQHYRQISIGITEKHVRKVHSPFNRYDDSSAKVDLNVVFAWQSGHRPLQRGITYGLDGAFPHQLQPALF
ncbi:hypothetical protein FOXG_14907 [Fusarium oxysporum f. sp. lycopersici 4287]|uniref:Uncharacterized protein n=1 Tax=Fusarium oxysporum f. sp. lycopersici (strain 4287 / CBS 123668 / FGSC 9935 / NRRL 34936) TaxID=426428 RepID=A0A0J9WTZ4_FUSO4|nr:hypothetical protein FOXG_14907 [Fusarium oxysporum f. sp. lycopersici 4287]KAJ9412497.1 hypothetical protein QL093DRAFT_1144761 [Fusarium oxysporum]KNB16887.1 hypothetical protein FOXG_14907 [Fusarium oxysporum f. sp. lycopersici 4287]